MIEALVTGRVGLDLYPEQHEVPLEDVRTFRQYAGGFATNVATGLARLGVRTAIYSGVGNDGHGRHIRRFLEREGVDCRWLGTHPSCLRHWPSARSGLRTTSRSPITAPHLSGLGSLAGGRRA